MATAAVVAGAPATPEQFAEAKLVKLAIVTDLAIYVQDQNQRPGAYDDHMAYVVSRLSRFDSMTSPDALKVFASLSGYYLGAPGEKLYSCLALRKGKPLQPYLEAYFRVANAECRNDLGQSFTKPSAALGGNAICPAPSQQRERLRGLIADIEIGATCSDADFIGLVRSAHK